MEVQNPYLHNKSSINHAVATLEFWPAIFNLNVDCFHEIFDWLSQKDIIAVGQTCKCLQRIAGDFFHANYTAKFARGENDGIYFSSLQSNIFCEYIQKLSISGDRLKAYQFIGSKCINSIKHFRVYDLLPDNGFEYVKEILHGIEFLEMNECIVNGEFYEKCLKYCPNVRNISVTRSNRIRIKSIIIGTGNEWLLRTYPKLEHFELTDSYGLKMNELKTFFEQNSNIRTFSTDSRTLWENRHSIIDGNVKLDKLAIDIYKSKTFDSNHQPISMIDAIYNLLVQLHDRQRLNLYMIFVDQQNINKLFSLNKIEMINGDIVRIDNTLVDVKAFAVWCGNEIENIESWPNNLPNIERIGFTKVNSNNILPFIRHSKKLKQIRIRRFFEGTYFKNGVLDVQSLNKERQKLTGARKVTIYVKEDIYLATKWAITTLDLRLIELRRFDSAEWEELSAKANYFKSL